jgi:hypothetical protein
LTNISGLFLQGRSFIPSAAEGMLRPMFARFPACAAASRGLCAMLLLFLAQNLLALVA